MGDNPAAKPQPQEDLDGDGRWMSIHDRFLAEVKEKEPEVVFIGDSHIALLEHTEVYKEFFAPLHGLCLGVRGDTTSNVLWRIQNGELEVIKPKVVVLLIGTNNRGQTPEQILGGIRAIVDHILKKQPQAALFVAKIPPRGEKPNPKRELLAKVNAGLANTLADVPNCRILDIDPGFVGADGMIDHRDMYDFLHLTPQGYRKAFEIVHIAVTSVLNPDSA